MRWFGLLVVGALLAATPAAHSQELNLPGLRANAQRYAHTLEQHYPAGATPAQRAQSEKHARDGWARQDWAAAAAALSERLGQGDTTAALWLALARALMREPRPDLTHALAAAWESYSRTDEADDKLAALRVMRDAFAALDYPVPEIEVLEEASGLAPNDPDLKRLLVTREQDFGLLVRKVSTDSESFPARACVAFIGTPSGSADFHPGDWVALKPAVQDATVTLESGRICISGLPPGERTEITFARGMPGTNGLSLQQPAVLNIAMPDRRPRLVFGSNRFLQPRGTPARVALASVNLSKVKLTLLRVSERALQPFLASHPLGSTDATEVTALRDSAREVWAGGARIPEFKRNALLHTLLPLPDHALDPPGLYLLVAQPDDGTPSEGAGPQAMQMVLRTDLSPTVWRGDDGLAVQVRGFAAAAAKPNVEVALIAVDNDVLARATTNAGGVAHFAAPLLRGTAGLAAAALHLREADGDFTTLDLNAPAFDLSDRGVSGRSQPGPIDTFVWLDRGIYRPGETVHAMALLRDGAGEPLDLPVHVVVTRPGGQVFSDTIPARAHDDALVVPIKLSGGAQAGTWVISVRMTSNGPTIAERNFQVEAFVPARLAVDIEKPPTPLPPGIISTIPLAVRFLYGAPGSSLSGSASLHLEPNPTPFAAFEQYRFGQQDEALAAGTSTFDLPETDAQGSTTLALDLAHLPDTTQALRADVTATINDLAGRPVTAEAMLPIRPAGPLIGIREDFASGAVDPGQQAGFDVIAVDPQGGRIAMPVHVTLVRQTPDWRLVVKHGIARYETVWRDQPAASMDASIAADAPLHLGWKLGFGRYKLLVVQSGRGLAAASVGFDAGWGASGAPDAPPRTKVSLDHARYKPGETARVHIEAPFAGPATLLVLSNRVLALRDIDVPAGGTDVEVPVGADWGAGTYIAVHVYRPAAKVTPDRAIGLAWLQIDPASRTLPVSFDVPEVLRPRGAATVTVHTAPGAWLTLAAVDEGVLRLTKFASPDPVGHYFGRRSLGIDIHDEFGRLLRPAEGTLTELQQGGGGDEGGAVPPIPQIVLSLFTPPVQAGPDGTARIPLHLPDFDGQLRLMAVAWSGGNVGAADKDVLVRDRLIAEPLLPRFLAPGDTARLGVLLQNVELPAGAGAVHVAASGALSLTGPARLDATLAQAARTVATTQLHADTAGDGKVSLDVTGPDGFIAHHERVLSVHPARGRIVVASSAEVPAGASVTVAPDASAFLPGTWWATLSLGRVVRYSAAALVQALLDYPMNCLEQVTSRGLPLAMLPDGGATPDRAGQLQQQVGSVLDYQRYDGAFGLWSANGEAQPWLTAYATEFLLRAREVGAVVPSTALASALGWLRSEIAEPPGDAEARTAQAYAIYVLMLAGQTPAGAIRVMASNESALPTPLARAQLAAALTRLSQDRSAAALFNAVLKAPARRYWRADYGSALRDQFATAVLLKESGVDPAALARLVPTLPGADLNPRALDTQEQAWGAAAAAALDAAAPPLAVSVDGKPLAGATAAIALNAPVTLRNDGSTAVTRTVSVSGVPRAAPPAARNQMQVRRSFHTLSGQALDPDKLKQNTFFVLVIAGKAEDGQAHQAMVLAGLPAGWEIAGRLGSSKIAGMDWLGELTETRAQPATDDRFAAALDLTAAHPSFRIGVILRAVTPGEYQYPGVELADMYRPTIFARQGAVRISVLPP